MGILLLLCSSGIGTVNTMLLKGFQKSVQLDFSHHILYLFLNGLCAMLYFSSLCRFSVVPDGRTLLYAGIYALIVACILILNVLVYRWAKIVVVSVIRDGGSFILSTLAGIWIFGESMRFGAVLAIFFRLFAIILPGRRIFKERSRVIGVVFCLLSAFVSTMSTIFMKTYALDVHAASPSLMFFWVNAFHVAVCGIIFGGILLHCLRQKKELPHFTGLQTGNIALMTAISNASSLLSTYILQMVDIFLYNILSGALSLLLVSAGSRLIYKEKITKDMWWSIGLSILAILFSAF